MIYAANNPVEASNSGVMAAKYHSALAMEAAKKMRRTRQKRKTGQVVCHHLRMMLSIETLPANRKDPEQPQYPLGF